VLKDGGLVKTLATSETDSRGLVHLMVGRELDGYFPPRGEPGDLGDVRLKASGVSTGLLRGVDLQVRAGEIVGLAGLQGSGRTELARAIFGADPISAGTIEVDGKPRRFRSPRAAVRAGLGFITEDRKLEGLALAQSITDNVLLAVRTVLPGARRRRNTPGLMSVKELAQLTELRARGPEQEVRFLSGGNQQKVVLAKWLQTRPQILIFDEPTRGIDVGAKAGIHDLIRKLAKEGVAILMISSELPELIGMSDRILVMHEGALAGELPGGASEPDIMQLATGHVETAA
jgi:ABC-type sugar transport system ATPase subunit